MGIDSTEGNGEERPEREIRRSPPAAPVAEERDEQGEGGERMGMGEKKLPLPPI